ncbi:uncharacterized protein PRCAT00004041001 [Priceomyces carsonii]|uniref:uncharacterized protein n=1 Tax=Priceomyces carsonii TaxID=28549 RepID=UPI002EDB10D1|nr:unnamed protein product [Priceomyces carsonii]
MSSTASSSFLEDPRLFLNEDSTLNVKQTISNLQFQLSTLQTEKKLLQLEKESATLSYEDLLIKKNEELKKLQGNFDFMYEQKKELDSKLENQTQISNSKLESLRQEVHNLTKENHELQEWSRNAESKQNSTLKRYEQVRSDFNFQLKINDELEEQIRSLKNEMARLQGYNDDLSHKLSGLSLQLTSNPQTQLLGSLQSKNLSLQKTNNQLQLKVDQLLQNKTSVELLRQKNLSLVSRVTHLENLEERYYQMEIENLELKSKLQDFLRIMDTSIKSNEKESIEVKIYKFLNVFKQLQDEKLIIRDRYSQAQAEMNSMRADNLKQQDTIENDLEPKLKSMYELVKSKDQLIDKLERQKLLNSKEIEYLRDLLKELDKAHLKNKKELNPTDGNETHQYLTNLEKLVDDYKNEIGKLQKQLSEELKEKGASPIGQKRKKIDRDDSITITINTQLHNLENENIKLRSNTMDLERRVSELNDKIKNLETLKLKRSQLQILQLKSNPASRDQAVKQQTLDALRKENEDLIKKYVKKDTIEELIPKSVFEREENDKELQQKKIDQLNKRNNRLREIYAKKSKDILSIISKYFGYTIEFLPSPINPNDLASRLKLVSKYINNKETVGNAHLIIDLESKTLKAYGNYEFKSLCEDLVDNWVNEKGQIPCLLSALNLKIYEKYVLGK